MIDKKSNNIDDIFIPNAEVQVSLKEAIDNGAIEEHAISLEDVLESSVDLVEDDQNVEE
ncbi:hypothetical protein [Commensalibacter nepenthis]|uniref:Uncharacterized protein n=1 Tax=Commensalibacter nepenthis TaxID=3043872 RepID=A0ABT6QAE4_9PROT|nr:hypothetical protein [Commensalibacter sp. TBRC 10068]MDI2113877.1 hypothetical protein [Commensalibacter sp. TBRC 10068]